MTLEVKDLTGGYTSVPVIQNVSFTVKPGELTGLIGLNGAGKSTTIKHIIGLMLPFSGQITINETELKQAPEKYRQSFAFVPETPVLYEELTLREHIEVTMMAYQLPKEETMEKVNRYLKAFRLEDKLEWFPAYFSKGMKQKVMLVCAFMIDVPLYVIDEPFLGLDPLGIHTFLEIIKDKNIDAIQCENDSIAIKVYKYLSVNNIKIPEDVAIIGFDNISATNYTQKKLSSIDHRIYDHSKVAVEALIKLINEEKVEKNNVIKPKLVIKETC